jgi:hypothetical protein
MERSGRKRLDAIPVAKIGGSMPRRQRRNVLPTGLAFADPIWR